MPESAWDFGQSTSFLIYSRQLSYLEKVLDILLKVSHRRSKRMAGWISSSQNQHVGKERSCFKMWVASLSRDRADPCPAETTCTGNTKKELFGYAFISKLNRPQAAGQFLWCACVRTAKLSFFFSLKASPYPYYLLGLVPDLYYPLTVCWHQMV